MPKSILLVDDDRMMLTLSAKKLEEKGYKVSTAEDGKKALELLTTQKPDLIISDVQMPDVNGYSFILEKNKSPELAKIPVIILTASKETAPLFKRHGAKAYLLKPLNTEELLAKVNEIIGQP